MNWKENAHLFANGKFEVQFRQKGETITGTLAGVRVIKSLNHVNVRIDTGSTRGLFWENPNDCQLIARHPEDMTDEEWGDECFDFYESPMGGWDSKDQMKEIIEERIEAGELHSQTLLYLLSIGVFPFPWPKDGSVIRREG